MDRPYSTSLHITRLLVLALVSACTPVTQGPPERPLSDRQVAAVLSGMEDQEKRVFSFYSVGRLTVGGGYWEPESGILIAGIREPFRIKMEITHPWGQPLVHILIDKDRLGVLSFPDKRLFLGDFTPEALSKFLAGKLDSRLVWAVLRGYPVLPDYRRIESREPNRIAFIDSGLKETETLEVFPDSLLPKVLILPDQQVELVFSEFQEDQGIAYAGGVKVIPPKGGRIMALKREKTVFNRPIPGEVFDLPRPAGFEVMDLDKVKGPSL